MAPGVVDGDEAEMPALADMVFGAPAAEPTDADLWSAELGQPTGPSRAPLPVDAGGPVDQTIPADRGLWDESVLSDESVVSDESAGIPPKHTPDIPAAPVSSAGSASPSSAPSVALPPPTRDHWSTAEEWSTGGGDPASPQLPHGRAPGKVMALIAGTMVVVALIFAVWSMLRVDGVESGGAGEDTASASAAVVTPSAASTNSTPPAQPSASSSASGAASIPAGATACGAATPDPAIQAYAGANTSCAFALAVATAYINAHPSGHAAGATATISAFSPVTNKDYSLECTGTQPVVCVTGNASVYLAHTN